MEDVLAAVARIVRAVSVPVTVDFERGYRLAPAELVERLAATGAIGLNLEDSDPATGGLAFPVRRVHDDAVDRRIRRQPDRETPMTLTFEFAHFTVRDGEKEALVAERPAMVRALQEVFPGALAAWLTRQDDGSWLDVVLWRSREEAQDAAERINSVPEAHRWFRHISQSHGVRHAEVAHEQLFALEHTEA